MSTAPDLEVVCVTGLPARTENVRAVFFLRPRILNASCEFSPISFRTFPGLQWQKSEPTMRSLKRQWLFGAVVFVLTAASYAQWSNPADEVPAYHPSAPLKVSALPPILAGTKLTGENFRYPWQVHVYQEAIKIGNVLYQLPCNCRCDRALGHTSLRSCYEGVHGTECSTCAKEAFYAYRLTKAGKSPAQIRAGIAQHDYESIVLEQQ